MDPIQRALDTVFPPEPVKPFEEIDHTSYLEWAGFHTTHTWDGYTGSDLYSFDRRGQLIDLVRTYANWLNALGVKEPWKEFRDRQSNVSEVTRYYRQVTALGEIAQCLYAEGAVDELIHLITLAGGEALSWLAEEQEKLNPTAENKGGEHYE